MNRVRRVVIKALRMNRVGLNKDIAMKPLFHESFILQVTAQSNKGNLFNETQIRPVMWPTVIVCIQAWMALLQIPLMSYGVSSRRSCFSVWTMLALKAVEVE